MEELVQHKFPLLQVELLQVPRHLPLRHHPVALRVLTHRRNDLILNIAQALQQEGRGLVLRVLQHAEVLSGAERLVLELLPACLHLLQHQPLLRQAVLELLHGLSDLDELFSLLPSHRLRPPQLRDEGFDCLLIDVVALGDLRLQLFREFQLPPHLGVLGQELVVALQQLLRLPRLVGELARHLLVLQDCALRGRLQLVVGELHHVGLRLLDLQRRLLLQAVFLLHRLALKVTDLLLVLLPLPLQRRFEVLQAPLHRRLLLLELREVLELHFVLLDGSLQLLDLPALLLPQGVHLRLVLAGQARQAPLKVRRLALQLAGLVLLGLQLAREVIIYVLQVELLHL